MIYIIYLAQFKNTFTYNLDVSKIEIQLIYGESIFCCLFELSKIISSWDKPDKINQPSVKFKFFILTF